jgi:hypothetical protein
LLLQPASGNQLQQLLNTSNFVRFLNRGQSPTPALPQVPLSMLPVVLPPMYRLSSSISQELLVDHPPPHPDLSV